MGWVAMIGAVLLFLSMVGGLEMDTIHVGSALLIGAIAILIGVVGGIITIVGVNQKKEGGEKLAAEKNFQNRVERFLKSEGVWYLKYWGGGRFTKAGIPDLILCVHGYFVAVELKAEHGTPSELQLYTIRQIQDSGGFAIVLYPSGFDQFVDFIHDLKQDNFSKDMEMIVK